MTTAQVAQSLNQPSAPDPIVRLQAELDGYYVEMRGFRRMDITEILMCLAAFSARAYEVRSYLVRNENRRVQTFRTKELDPFIEACDQQFKIFSRLQSVRQMEADMSRGGV